MPLVERSLQAAIAILGVAWVMRRADTFSSPPQPAMPPASRPVPVASAVPTAPPPQATDLRERVLTVVRNNMSGWELANLLDEVDTPAQRTELANSVHVEAGPHGLVRKTALFLACANRSPGLARTLLSSGANVSAGRLDEGTTPMHLAAGWLHSEDVVEVLLSGGQADGVMASLRAKPASGGLRRHTPVWWALYYQHPRTHHRLVEWMRGREWDAYDVEVDAFVRRPAQVWTARKVGDGEYLRVGEGEYLRVGG